MTGAADPEAAPSYVRFTARGGLYALPLADVAEVVCPEGPFSAVPRAPASAVGIMNLHGRAVPVVDLAALLADDGGREPAYVLLLAHARRRLGVGVDAVEGIGPLEVEGETARHEGRRVSVLTGTALMDSVDLCFAEVAMLNVR